jgi:hypothetical protein
VNPSIVLSVLSHKLSLPYYLEESEPFYFYPKGHVINWHTNKWNLNEDENLLKYRMYTVSSTGNSYFLYCHPISKKIHALKDIDETTIVLI